MHISEGILTFPTLASGFAISGIGVYVGIKKLEFEKMVQASVLTASFFLASLIHIPVGISSSHLILNGIIGILAGWMSFPIIALALFLQGIIFQFGGITTLGVNTAVIATPSIVSFYLFSKLIKKYNDKKIFFIASFLCGFLSVFLSVILFSIFLIASDENFFKMSFFVICSQIPIMIIEGFCTFFFISFLKKMKYLS